MLGRISLTRPGQIFTEILWTIAIRFEDRSNFPCCFRQLTWLRENGRRYMHCRGIVNTIAESVYNIMQIRDLDH